MDDLCSVATCGRPRSARRGWCARHYRRWLDTGDIQADVPIRRHTIASGSTEERFWARVRRTPTCWLWPVNGRGDYGTWSYREGDRKITIKPHRFAWGVAYGAIPEGAHILHRCDNPPCVRPDHLFLGTHLDNMRDKVAKGRARGGDARGERNGNAKLTASQVIDLRARAAQGERQCDLAREFGITPQATWNIINRHIWRHI